MRLSFDRRLSIWGAILALLGIGITILWADFRLLGWFFLALAGLGIILWLCAEARAFFVSHLVSTVSSVLITAIISGGFVLLIRNSAKPKSEKLFSEAQKPQTEQQTKEPPQVTQTLPQFGRLDPFANITNVRLDDLTQTDVQRLNGAGGRWCMGDFQKESAKREILAHSAHRDSNGNITPESKRWSGAIEKTRDLDERKYDAEQSAYYRDIAKEASSLERELLHRLHYSEKQGILPDKDTGDVFLRLANAKYKCRDFETASSYLGKLEQQFDDYNAIRH